MTITPAATAELGYPRHIGASARHAALQSASMIGTDNGGNALSN